MTDGCPSFHNQQRLHLNSVNLFDPHKGHSQAFKRTMTRKELRAILDAGYRLIGAEPCVDSLPDGTFKNDAYFVIERISDGVGLKVWDWADVKRLATLPPLQKNDFYEIE